MATRGSRPGGTVHPSLASEWQTSEGLQALVAVADSEIERKILAIEACDFLVSSDPGTPSKEVLESRRREIVGYYRDIQALLLNIVWWEGELEILERQHEWMKRQPLQDLVD